MPKLNADFVADWVAMLRSYLIDEQRWPAVEIAALPDGDLPSHYFDAQRRRIASLPEPSRLETALSAHQTMKLVGLCSKRK